jgi:hypothetical protein
MHDINFHQLFFMAAGSLPSPELQWQIRRMSPPCGDSGNVLTWRVEDGLTADISLSAWRHF